MPSRKYYFLLDSRLRDRSRIILGILARFGAFNKPTVIHSSDPFSWFLDDPDETRAAWYELNEIGAIQYSKQGQYLTVIICREPDETVEITPPAPPAEPAVAPKPRRSRKQIEVH